jgi:hypothetical protein
MFKALPRFPILLCNDVPLLLVSGYVSLGRSRSLELHMDYFREHGRLRKRALRPPNNPLTIRSELIASKRWSTFVQLEGSDEAMVLGQLLRMLDDVPAARKLLSERGAPALGSDDEWEELAQEVERLGIRWNPRLNSYRQGAAR